MLAEAGGDHNKGSWCLGHRPPDLERPRGLLGRRVRSSGGWRDGSGCRNHLRSSSHPRSGDNSRGSEGGSASTCAVSAWSHQGILGSKWAPPAERLVDRGRPRRCGHGSAPGRIVYRITNGSGSRTPQRRRDCSRRPISAREGGARGKSGFRATCGLAREPRAHPAGSSRSAPRYRVRRGRPHRARAGPFRRARSPGRRSALP